MELNATDRRLLAALAEGLPLDPRPYARLAEDLGLDEAAVIARTRRLIEDGAVNRFGVIVRHRPLGYRANAMVVWDVPDERVAGVGRRMAALAGVTLCYRRPRRLPQWPYNLFCMIHGRERGAVEALVGELAAACGIETAPRAILFSRRCFKQRGARYTARDDRPAHETEAA